MNLYWIMNEINNIFIQGRWLKCFELVPPACCVGSGNDWEIEFMEQLGSGSK